MSNHLAVATVSAALGRLLQGALDMDVPGARVSHERPGGPGDDARRGINIFLFQVTPNSALRNVDLPVRNGSGQVVGRASAALDLHYLLTCYGDAASFEPERMLGTAARILHERPLLDRPLVTGTVEDPANLAALGGSDLADAHDLVKFSPTPLNLEELSKLWSILFQTPYRLSLAYRAALVQIDARDEVPGGLPVRRRGPYVIPISAAGIDAVQAIDGPTRPIVWGGRIVLAGRGFALPGASLLLNGVVATPDPAAASAGRLEVVLQPASLGGTTLPAGVATARVRLPPPAGAPPQLARETQAVPFLLRPSLTLPGGGRGRRARRCRGTARRHRDRGPRARSGRRADRAAAAGPHRAPAGGGSGAAGADPRRRRVPAGAGGVRLHRTARRHLSDSCAG